MRIDAVSMQSRFVFGNDKTGEDRSLKVRQLEEAEKSIQEELEKIQSGDSENESHSIKQKNIQMQFEHTNKQAVSMMQDYANLSMPEKVSEASENFVDRYVKSDDLSSSGGAGIYGLGKDENGNPKIVSGKSEASNSHAFSGGSEYASEAEKLDETAKEDKPEEVPGEEDEAERSPEAEDEEAEKAVEDSSDDDDKGQGTVNTNGVDAEIRKLKQEKQQIRQSLQRAAGDDASRESLQKRLDMIEAELKMKETDTYRKQHSVYTESNG